MTQPKQDYELYEDTLKDKETPKKQVAFQKYFEGYTIVKVPKKFGKGYTVTRIYTDFYLMQDITDEEWKRRRLAYIGMELLSLFLFLFGAVRRLPSNTWKPIGLITGITLVCMVFSVIYVLYYATRPRLMKRYDGSHVHKKVIRWCMASGGTLILMATAAAVFTAFVTDKMYFAELINVVLYILAGALNLVISRIEKDTFFLEKPNDTKIPLEAQIDE